MSEESQTTSTLQDWLDLFWILSCILLVLAVLVLGGNWLDEFLHAPIGIEDNPTQPGAILQVAHLAFWPTYILWGVLACQRFSEINAKTFSIWLVALLGAAGLLL